jgi:hypothetical protein
MGVVRLRDAINGGGGNAELPSDGAVRDALGNKGSDLLALIW